MREKASGVLSPVTRVKGGVRVLDHKNTRDREVSRLAETEAVTLPMLQHIGAPCSVTVSVGDDVCVGQIVGDCDAYVSVPVHASVSGVVSAVGTVKTAQGKAVQAVTIKSDGEMRLHPALCPPVVNNREDFIRAVRNSGLVGLGGAGFPSHVKLNVPPEKKIDTLIVNAAECEPYITADYRECVENAASVISGAALIKYYLGIENVIIAVEDNKPAAIDKLCGLADKEKGIRVMSLKSAYPQGAEKMLIYSAAGRKVPLGKLPADVGCIVMNVAGVSFLDRYMKTGKPLISRTVTVDGSAVADPQNVRVPIGVKIQDLIDFCGGFLEPPYKMITGGPLMGVSLIDTNAPVLKTHNAVLAFTKGTYNVKTERDCIRCGRCVHVCPMKLVPTDLERYAKARDAEKLRKSYVNACMECGSCAYVCPSGRPLVQYLVLGKDILREAVAKDE